MGRDSQRARDGGIGNIVVCPVSSEIAFVFKVRQQHLDRGLEFLCDELHMCDRKEASEHRMFFISAREALLSRNNDPTSSPRSGFNEGNRQVFMSAGRLTSPLRIQDTRNVSSNSVNSNTNSRSVFQKRLCKPSSSNTRIEAKRSSRS